MKKYFLAFLIAAALLLGLGTGIAEQQKTRETKEWTVMFYVCGSDLESKHGYASQTMHEIVLSKDPYSANKDQLDKVGLDSAIALRTLPDAVNVVIQTGGCKQWQANKSGETITDAPVRSNVLQRWSYDPYDEKDDVIRLEQALPLQNMSAPDTLTDFIRWGAERYPAQKYLLVLWGHGGGSKTGIFVDELFRDDIMYIYELKEALNSSGVTLEAVLFDSCMMANIETACAVKDSARWMIASEEVVMGKGTAVLYWLNELCKRPSMDGRRLGRIICDSAQEKYASDPERQSVLLVTWSVIDLSKIDAVVEYIDQVFAYAKEVYVRYPKLLSLYLQHCMPAEHYGSSSDRMIDLTDPLFTTPNIQSAGLESRNRLVDALEDAVVYCVKGSGRSKSKGLSFCFATALSDKELDIYAKNCPSPHYLALLDAVTSWTAPSSLYKQINRLPEIDELPGYGIVLDKRMGTDGVPGVAVIGSDANVSSVTCYYYGLNDLTGNVICLGYVPTGTFPTVDGREQLSIIEPWEWPNVEYEICCLNLVQHIYGDSLCEIPMQIGVDQYLFRCGYTEAKGYEMYGIWEGFNSTTNMFNRNVMSLSQMAGQDYRLLYPIVDPSRNMKIIGFEQGPLQTMYLALKIESKPLPPGTYYIQYVVEDMFLRRIPMDWVEIKWDGKKITVPNAGQWKGTVKLRWQ